MITAPNSLPTDRPLTREPAPQMRERLRTMLPAYVANQPAFAALNPRFEGPDFADGFQAALTAAEKVRDYESRLALGEQATLSEADALAACRPRCQALFYAVRQAWPEKAQQAARLQEFGQTKYDEARDQSARMLALIEQADLAYRAPGYASLLDAQGWRAAQHTALLAAAEALRQAAAAQGRQRGLNAEETAAYYRAQNAAYWFGQQLNAAAAVIFADAPDKEAQFRLTPEGPERFTFTLRPGQRKARHLDGLLAPDRVLRVRVKGAAPDPTEPKAALWIDFLPAEDGPLEHRRPLTPTLKRQPLELRAADLGEAGPWLAVENLTGQEAEVVVTIAE